MKLTKGQSRASLLNQAKWPRQGEIEGHEGMVIPLVTDWRLMWWRPIGF